MHLRVLGNFNPLFFVGWGGWVRESNIIQNALWHFRIAQRLKSEPGDGKLAPQRKSGTISMTPSTPITYSDHAECCK